MNQYNVFAYKKIIRGINVYPKFTGITPSGVLEITADVSRKISKDGKYIVGLLVGMILMVEKPKLG